MSQIRLIVVALVGVCTLLSSSTADAFCGFYVSGADAKLYNNATMVVMMRDGMRTVLSMQNNYEGPPSDFAMVVPVPVVLQKANVKTLDRAVFDKVDAMAAPRLVEYWEQDPCWQPTYDEFDDGAVPDMAVGGAPPMVKRKNGGYVKVEAKFAVGEYEIVILKSNDAGTLDKWLRQRKYKIPKGAEKVMGPYIEQGMYFFVAKVDAKKVKFEGNQARLSPLRFHYDTKDFLLPMRLGLLNAKGHQDLIVHILARGQRYEAANYKNVTIPTNIDVDDAVRKNFGGFYATLFDKTLEKNKGAVVTEYAWDASTCDPCPGPNLGGPDFLTLGADVLKDKPQRGFVLTRLHARYTRDSLGEDIQFKAAPPIVGGREVYLDKNELEQGSKSSSVNNFQGRYAIRHVWEGEIKCKNPVRGRWGGPPGGKPPSEPTAARDTAFAKRDAFVLPSVVRRDIPEIGVSAETTTRKLMSGDGDDAKANVESDGPGETKADEPRGGEEEGSSGCATAPGENISSRGLVALLLLGMLISRMRR